MKFWQFSVKTKKLTSKGYLNEHGTGGEADFCCQQLPWMPEVFSLASDEERQSE